MKIVLIGYYGNHNLGDDLMLQGILKEITPIETIDRIYVYVREDYFKNASDKTIFIPSHGLMAKVRLLYCVAVSRFTVLGGGTFLYERKAERNDGLRSLYWILKLAKLLRSRLLFWGIGIGNIYTKQGRLMIRKLLEMAQRVIFREEGSLRIAVEITGARSAYVIGDDVFFLNKFAPRVLERNSPPTAISFSGVHFYKNDETTVLAYAAILDRIAAEFNARIFFIPFHQGEKSDNEFHMAIARRLTIADYEVYEYDDPIMCLERMKSMDFHIGMRLHSVAAADCLNVPNIAINYEPKVRFYLEQQGLGAHGRLAAVGEDITPSRMLAVQGAYAYAADTIVRRQDRAKRAALVEIAK